MKKEVHTIAVLVFTAILILGSAAASLLRPDLPEAEPPAPVDTLPRGMCVNYIISPYDSIIKVYADSVGLDWRLVSAVVYHESGYDPEVVSRRGAAGLMQMMPETARWLGVEDVSDPIEGVRAGTKYLGSLHRGMRRHVEDPSERIKFTLAAYNAGIGRVYDCINYARLRGVDSLSWDAVVDLIPEMNSDEILEIDTVKFGKFKGTETIAYVQNVLDKYEQYKRRASR